MFHKFKITTCVFILCLFGLTLTPDARPDDTPVTYIVRQKAFTNEFDRCKGKSRKNKSKMRERKNCFGRLARTAATEDLGLYGRQDRPRLREDFASCKKAFCAHKNGSELLVDDDVGIDQDCTGTITHLYLKGALDYTAPTKKEHKEAMHCYAAIAREVYDKIND